MMAAVQNGSIEFMSPEFIPGLVSVIIPTHNRATMIRDAIRSALNQTYPDVEVIVVDDGSTDETALEVLKLVAEYGARKLRYERQSKSGAPTARNRGLQLCRGEFIQFLDSDDVLHPEKFERQVALLRANEDVEMTYCVTELFSERPGDLKATRWQYLPAPDLPAFIRWPSWDTNSPLWRREALVRLGPWRADLLAWQDWEYHVRAISRGIKAVGLPEILSYLREHGYSRIDLPPPTLEKIGSFLRACELASQHLDQMGVRRGAAREALARRARGVGLLFLERNAPALARKVLRLGIAQRPNWLRRAYMMLLCGISFLPGGRTFARFTQGLCPTLGAIGRRAGLLPRDETPPAVKDSRAASLRFLPRQ